jgi:ribokinase
MDVVGLGALNLDIIYQISSDNLRGLKGVDKGTEKRINLREFKQIKRFLKKKGRLMIKSGGGSAANTVYALARMGLSCGFVGKVGEDEEGNFLLEELGRAGVDTSRIVREGKSGICLILVDERGERSTFILPNTNDTLSFKEIDINYIQKARILHTSSFLGRKSFYTQREVVLQTENLLSFDPGHPHAMKGWKEIFPFLKRTYLLFTTQKEIELLSGENFKEGSRKLLKCGIKAVVCKMGFKGSWIISPRGEWFIPAQLIEAVDTTGAGDVYAAGFLAGMLKGLPLPQCGKLGTRAAALSITGWGRSSYSGEKLLEEF